MLSVIVPIFNAEKYLDECIDSIISQSEKNLEIILVDDGSTDNSLEICRKYEVQDARVRVIHQKNQGVTVARKVGVLASKGEYIAFVDSDDWIDKEFYQDAMTTLKEFNADIVLTDIYLNEADRVLEIRKNRIKRGYYSGEDLKQDVHNCMLHFPNSGGYPFGIIQYLVCKVFKRELVEAILCHMDETIFDGEDVICTFISLLKAKSIYVMGEAYYHYRMRTDSVCHKKKDTSFLVNAVKVYEVLENEFMQSDMSDSLNEQLKYFIAYYLNNCTWDIFGFRYKADSNMNYKFNIAK